MEGHYVYILYSIEKGRFYIGETANLEKRLQKHNAQQVISTKAGVPWIMLWNVENKNRSSSRLLEKKIKSRGARRFLNDIEFKHPY